MQALLLGHQEEWALLHKHCEATFRSLNAYLASLPYLIKPLPDETLFLYTPISDTAVSAVLVLEDEGVQKLVYYVSKSLIDTQTRYTRIENLIFAFFIIT